MQQQLQIVLNKVFGRGALALLLSSLLAVNAPLEVVAAANPPAAPAPAAAQGTREPLVEVSVDSLEISESNANIMGIIWGNASTGTQFNLSEKNPTPSLLPVGPFQRTQITAQLDAMIKNNQARILANPTLLTKSGFEANFLVGGEVPVLQVGQGGVSGVEYKKYGVTLKILPTITPRGTIEAQVNIGVSALDPTTAVVVSGVNIPGLTTREAGSKVEVKDGETLVLAGIKQSHRQKEVIRVPVLGYIPILGLLFRHTDEETIQTSLVLFVTFRLIKD